MLVIDFVWLLTGKRICRWSEILNYGSFRYISLINVSIGLVSNLIIPACFQVGSFFSG